jgi:hypothetical protein
MNENCSLIVRVKRRRDQEPVDQLCIVEDIDDHDNTKSKKRIALDTKEITAQLSSLSPSLDQTANATSSASSSHRSQIVLSRFYTTLSKDLDALPDEATSQPTTDDKSNVYVNDRKSSVWIPHGKKLHRSASKEETMIIVDVSQEAQLEISSSNVPTQSESHVYIESMNEELPPATKIKVYDPASRMMDDAIDKAWRVGDFNAVANALSRGANVNFQRDAIRNGGVTALMAAVKHCNARMVKRLLDNGARTDIKNSSNMTAVDLLHSLAIPATKQDAYMDISIALNKAMTKYHMNVLRQDDSLAAAITVSSAADVEYVYDIFRYKANTNKRSYDTLNSDAPIADKPSATAPQTSPPIIAVPGIHIHQDGNVDLVFAYDSDWSELGDDEDVDSNDERFEGNDYPEDEDDDADDEDVDPEELRKNIKDEDSDSDSGGSGRNGWNRHRPMRNRVGYVNPYVVPGADSSSSRDTKSLQKLWDEDHHSDDEDEGDIDGIFSQQESRLAGMHEASGMEFASNPLEFDRNGLAKFGNDIEDEDDDYDGDDITNALSRARLMYERRMDEEYDSAHLTYSARYVDDLPPRNTVAYDPEYDD